MAKAKKAPAPAEPVAKIEVSTGEGLREGTFTVAHMTASEVEMPKPTIADTPPPVSGPRKNAPSGAKRLVHNGVVIDIPDTVKRRAEMSYDGTTVAVECPRNMDPETFRDYIEQAASELSQILDERNRRSKLSKAAERILVEVRSSISALTPEMAGGGEIYASLMQQKSLDVTHAQRRASEAAAMLKVQDALLDDAKRRWLNAE